MRLFALIGIALISVLVSGCLPSTAENAEPAAVVTLAVPTRAGRTAAPTDELPLPAITEEGQSTAAPLPTLPVPTPTLPPPPQETSPPDTVVVPTETPTSVPPPPTFTPAPLPPYPLQIEVMRSRGYPGSPVTFVEQIAGREGYVRHVVSYISDGLTIYGLLATPNGSPPPSGWPVILLNHGRVDPATYNRASAYSEYIDLLARAGYMVFMSDYRGHANSQGFAVSSFQSPDYTTDVLNALAAIKTLPDVDPNHVGMLGHSMGGNVTLRAMVVSGQIRVGVIWAGSVGTYIDDFADMFATSTPEEMIATGHGWLVNIAATYGTPQQNPTFWNSISPNSYLGYLSGPLQLHHGTEDTTVPYTYSEDLASDVQAAGKYAELYLYPGDNHTLSGNFGRAMATSISFFDVYLRP